MIRQRTKTLTRKGDDPRLFSAVGKLMMCRREQDKFGKMLDSAVIMFEESDDATKAFKEYNEATLDDSVIKITFLGDSGRR